MAVVTATMYKAARGIPSGNTAQDTNIASAITSATSLILAETGRALESATFTEYHDGTGQTVLQLRNPPVTAFTSLSVLSGVDSWTVLDTDSYRRIDSRGIVIYGGSNPFVPSFGAHSLLRSPTSRKHYGLPEGTKNIRVIYTGGYASGALEAALLEPFYNVVDWVREGWGRVRSALSDGSAGTVRVNRAAADEREALHDLMRPFRPEAI